MSTRDEMKARVRRELGATAGNEIWLDDHIYELLDEGVDWYSHLWPDHYATVLNVVEGQRAFAMGGQFWGIKHVECPPGRVLAQMPEGSVGDPAGAGEARTRQGWWLWGKTIYLTNGASGVEVGVSKLVVTVVGPWVHFSPNGDAWTGPEEDERLIVLWVVCEAWKWLEGEWTRRGKAAPKGADGRRQSEIVYEALQREIEGRKRRIGSRLLEVVR